MMNPRMRGLLLSAALVMIVTLWALAPASHAATPPRCLSCPTPAATATLGPASVGRLVIVGDSVTVAAAMVPPQEGYAALVAGELNAQPLVEIAHGGWDTPTAQAAVNAQLASIAGAQLLIVELGTNDLANATSFATWQQQYATMIQTLRTQAPFATLVCLTPWRAVTQPTTSGASEQQFAGWIDQTCGSDVGQGNTVALEPIYSMPGTQVGNGDTHPNQTGHQDIAAAIMAVLDGIHRVP